MLISSFDPQIWVFEPVLKNLTYFNQAGEKIRLIRKFWKCLPFIFEFHQISLGIFKCVKFGYMGNFCWELRVSTTLNLCEKWTRGKELIFYISQQNFIVFIWTEAINAEPTKLNNFRSAPWILAYQIDNYKFLVNICFLKTLKN